MRTSLSTLALVALAAAFRRRPPTTTRSRKGASLPSITDGGVTFTNLDNGFGGTQNFVIDQADGDLTGIPGFTPLMTLGFGGWSPGPHVGFSRIISCDITTGQTADTGSIEVFELGSYAGNTITLEAYSGASPRRQPAGSDPDQRGIHYYALSISGVTFRSDAPVGGGPSDSGAFFAVVDHVA
jgi:hypothetical protein